MKTGCQDCFVTLGVKTRFNLYKYLLQHRDEAVNVSTLVKQMKLTQPTITFHLNRLAKSGLVDRKKSGREVNYRVRTKCRDCLLNHI